jgi:hypothetical protein
LRTTSHPRVAVLQHEPATGPGAFSGLLRESGVHYELLGTNDSQAFRYGTSAYGLQFHPEVRVRDLHRWAGVAGYADLRNRMGVDWRDLATELARATPALDKLVKQLLDRWLDLVTEFASRRARMRLAV